jgi:pilus assembly protein Flp/PilA
MVVIQWLLASLLRDRKGATAVEYGLMVALIAIVIIAAVLLLGQELANIFNLVAQCVGDPTNCNP